MIMDLNQNYTKIMTKEECREQIQEDILAYTEDKFEPWIRDVMNDDLCQIVVDNFKKLEDK